MQLVLNLASTVNIKRKKPWPRLFWIGQEQDGLYIFDGKRVSQLYVPSGKTKKKIPKLHGLMNDVCALNVSENGQFLCGALCDGKIFLWERDKDEVQFVTGLPKVFNDSDKGNTKNQIFLSSCGNMMLLMMGFDKIFLWQRTEKLDSDDSHNITGTWSQVHHGEYSLPDQSNKEATTDGVFYSDEVVGRCGAFSYIFNKGTELAVTTLVVESHDGMNVSSLAHNIPNQDEETTSHEVVENVKYSIKWRSVTRPLYSITPATRLVKGRYVYTCRSSPDGQMLAIVLNQKLAKNTRLMFCSTLHSTSCIVDMKCCGGSDQSSGRTWWVSDLAWTRDSLLLIGITRNGAMFITTRLGEPLNLITTGHGMELGPNLFLSLHPRITVKSFQENIPPDNSEISSASEKDIFHQTFSIAVHPCLPLLLCSDGYMVTIFHLNSKPDYSKLITDLTKDASRFLSRDVTVPTLEQTSGNLQQSPHALSNAAVSAVIAHGGNDASQHSSPGSTLSETASGFGITKGIEAGVIMFGGAEENKHSSIDISEMETLAKMMKVESILLHALRIGTSCGPHWSRSMPVAMNLVIHTWAKVCTILLENDSNCGQSNKDGLFHIIMTFLQSCFEAFRWDISYQHCLPWFTQFVHSTVKCLVCSKNFGSREIIDVCMKLLRMAEVFLNEIYAWFAVNKWTTIHFSGDSFLPSCNTVGAAPSPTNNAMNAREQSSNTDRPGNINLDCKLDQSWLTLYHYVCKLNKCSQRKENHAQDEDLLTILCCIQRKLQAMNSCRNLISKHKMESLSDQGYKMYLDGNYSEAADLLERHFHETSKDICSTEAKPRTLELNLRGATRGQTLVSSFGASLIDEDLSSQLSAYMETLLSILYINLENYDLKAALALVYSFINTTRGGNLQDQLDVESPSRGSQTFISAGDSEVKVTSSSSLEVLQLSVLVRYPLAWIIENCAMPVVRQLASFMARYFTNLPLTIPTPFYSRKSVRFLEGSNKGNILEVRNSATDVKNLSQQRLTEGIGQQKLEGVWSADHTMELLLISGLLGEAAWFANRLGDWKIAFLLSVTEEFRKKKQSYVQKKSQDYKGLLSAIEVPQPEQLMKERIKMILKLDRNIMETDVEGTREMFDEEHIGVVQNVLEASVIAELNLVPGIIKQLVTMLRDSVSKLNWIVPQDVYLPAPPLYCPQPARNDGDVLSEETRMEIFLRTEIANIVQKILAMFRASSCFLYCAQEYCKHVVTNWSESDVLPSIINECITTEGVYIDTSEDSGVVRSFQEFCGLMWLLDVRNELALSSRKYSKLKQTLSLAPNDERRQEVIQQCEEVLVWLQRLMPFSHFLNVTDEVLDGILTLLFELPLNCETVDLLAQYFHTPSPSLSLATTEKLNRMTRRIRNNAGHFGQEKGESLTVRFQQQCKKRRDKENNVSAKQPESNSLEPLPTFCESVHYEHDSAFLRFLDTFLLITLAKNVTSDDYKKVPLIQPYTDRPTLKAEMSSIETATRAKEKCCRKNTLGIQRSQSFHDVGNIKKKSKSSLLSPSDLDSNEHKQVNRSNSLTDLRRIQPSNLSEELQKFLPVLLWLKRWCLVDESHKGNQGANKSYSFLNMTTTPTAIRIQLPLKLVVNTLWLDENYYKDYGNAKGRCVRVRHSHEKKRKVSSTKVRPEDEGKDTMQEASHGRSLLNTEVREENAEVEAVVESLAKDESEGRESERGRRRRKRRFTDSRRKNETADELDKITAELEPREDLEMEKETNDEVEENVEGMKVEIRRKTEVNGTENLEELSAQTLRRRKRTSKNVTVSRKQKEELDTETTDEVAGKQQFNQTLVDNQTRDRQETAQQSVTKSERRVDKDPQDSVIIRPAETKTSNQDLPLKASNENILSRSGIKKKLFSSPTASSIESKWKSVESVNTDIPLFSFSSQERPDSVFGGKSRNMYKYSSEMLSNSDTSNVPKAGMLGSYPRLADDDLSLSSDSLSVGQIRSDVAIQLKIAASMASETSVTTDRRDKRTKPRKAAKRKMYDESSTSELSEKPRGKPVDEASLLRRIIRSEMRKFIKAQQDEIKSKSSTYRTTDESLNDESSKTEGRETKGVKSRVSRKSSSQQPAKSSPLEDSPALADRQAVSDHGTSNQPPASEDETSISCPRRSHDAKLNVAATATNPRNTEQYPAAPMIPPLGNESNFPTVPGWPMWYNPTFPPPPPWLWPNAAPKVNSEKGTQVENTGEGEDEPKIIEIPIVVEGSQDKDFNYQKDAIIDVAVQTECSAQGAVSQEDSTPEKNAPFLLSLNDLTTVRSENQERGGKPDKARYKRPSNNEHTINTSTDDPKEFSQHHDVFAKDLSSCERFTAEHSHGERNCDGDTAPSDDPFTIPLLKFATEVHSPVPQSLPFKIAWPENTDVEPNGRVELPLLQLGDGTEPARDTEYFPAPLPITNTRHFENAPLLQFSHENDERSFRDFRFVQLPETENVEFPLLYLPEARPDAHNFFSDSKKSMFGKRAQKGSSDDTNLAGVVGETSQARMKRRNQQVGNVFPKQTTIKPSQARKQFPKQTSSESPSSDLEHRGARITVQPADVSKTTKPRRDRLLELNNIIRDLQRDINNDDDLVASELSAILSPEIRYENFEAKPQVKKPDKHESKSTTTLPSFSRKFNDGHLDLNTGVSEKPTIPSRLYKPAAVTARDIHTQIPSDVPEQSLPVDAKVGTVNVLRFPVSVQTDAVVPPQLDTFSDLPPSPRRSETKEFSVQTELEPAQVKYLSHERTTRDAAINTENVAQVESKSAVPSYPRLPADIYLDIRDIQDKPSEAILPSTVRDPVMDKEEENGRRMFLSVVDITGNDVQKNRRQENETIKERKQENHRKSEDASVTEGFKDDDTPDVSAHSTAGETFSDDLEKGDHTTVAVLSSKQLQRTSSLGEEISRNNSLKQAQKISKEKLSRRLLEMNEQFDAIEQLTSNMEQDLQRSNRLLRTIENLNKVTDHESMPEVDKWEKATRQKVAKTVGRQALNTSVTDGAKHFPDESDGEQIPKSRDMRYNVLEEDNRSVLKSRPWINKPIDELTEFVSDDHPGFEERSPDSHENSGDSKTAAKNDNEDVSLVSAQSERDSGTIARSDSKGDLEGDRGTIGDIHSQESSVSNYGHPSTVKSHAEPLRLVNPGTTDTRLKLSLTPDDVLNVSREKLKEMLGGNTSLLTNSRGRGKTPQKQQELREWMTKKRKLRHKEWTEKRNENRQAEFKPFQSKIQGEHTAMSTKKLKTSEKERRENRRTQTKEHVDERLMSAYDLMNEMITEHAPKGPVLITQTSQRNTQRQVGKKTSRVKANNRYKEKRSNNSRTSKPKPTVKSTSTRASPGQVVLQGSHLPIETDLGDRQSRNAPVYEYDIKESGRQFITRKSYESYQQKMSASFDFDRSISIGSPFNIQHSFDPRVDELLEDVSLGDSLDKQGLDNLDSLLSGDSELRDLLSDVIVDKPRTDLLETRDDVIYRNSRNVIERFSRPEEKRGESPIQSKRNMMNTFKVDSKGKDRVKPQDSYARPSEDVIPDVSEDDNFEMSDEVAALLAEAKAAVGDDFSGTSEVGDIDWNEVDHVLQQN